MLTINDEEALSHALMFPLDPQLADLLRERLRQLGGEFAGSVQFILIQAFDKPRWVAEALGWSIFQNPVDDTHWGDPEYTPVFEFIQDHGFAYELTFELTSDFTHVIFVENAGRVHPDFLSFCQQYASQHA